MSFLKTKWFKYLKNLFIGVGAATVLMGALFKLESLPGASMMLTIGLVIEACIFLFLGLIGPEKDYYWEKLYPGLDKYGAAITPLTEGGEGAGPRSLDPEVVEGRLGGMLDELQMMSKSLGSLKALQEVDFQQTGQQIEAMGNFYSKMNDAMASLNETVEDTKIYQENLASLNRNLSGLNSVYGNVLSAMKGPAS